MAETGKSLERIVSQVSETNQMDPVTRQNAAMVEKTTAAVHSPSRETAQLSGLIGQFQIGWAGEADSIGRELQKVAPRAFRRPAKAAPAKGARAEKRKPASRPIRAAPKAMVLTGAPVGAQADGCEEF